MKKQWIIEGGAQFIRALRMTVIEDSAIPVTATTKSNKHPGSHK
jgi:hypothetical protein